MILLDRYYQILKIISVKSRIELLWNKTRDAHSNYAITPLTFSNDHLRIVIENEDRQVKRIHTIYEF